MSCISLSKISFAYNSYDTLFENISVAFDDHSCVAIVGDNGTGKSTLLKIIAGILEPVAGHIKRDASIYYMPQIHEIDTHSGGERQSRELRCAFESGADILLLDEPTNNLDSSARAKFFQDIRNYHKGIIIVSHDRELLRQMDYILELSHGELRAFGGNYDFYVQAKNIEHEKLVSKYTSTTKELNRLNRTIIVAQQMRQHHEAKQAKEIQKSRRSRLEANALSGKSQETEAKKRKLIQKKIDEQSNIRQDISTELRDDKIKIPLPCAGFIKRELVNFQNVSFCYGEKKVLDDFSFSLNGRERIRVIGRNGSGKTTLLNLVCGKLKPTSGRISCRGDIAYLDQNLALLDPTKNIIDNIMDVSCATKHDAHAIAANFGFRGDESNKIVGTLSGGELLKATLAAVLGGVRQPELLILDEPTNNLDIKSMEILEDALNQYTGAILLVSHDEIFVQNLHLNRTIEI